MKVGSTQVVVVFILTVAFFGTSFPAIKVAEEGFTPASIVLLRAVLASGALALMAVAFRVTLRMPWRDLLAAAAIGQLGISLFQWVLNSAIAQTSIGVASTIVNTAPLVSLVLSAIVLRESIPMLRWMGMAISFIGIYLLGTSTGVYDSRGIALLIVASLSLGVYSVALKPLLARHHPLTVTLHGTWPGAFLFAWAAPGVFDDAATAGLSAWIGVAVLVVVVTCGGYVLLARLIQVLPVSRVVVYYYLVPPVAILYSMILFGDIPSAREGLGVAIVITGVALALSAGSGQRASRPQVKTPEAR